MPHPESFSAEAFNPVPESENRIHSDEVARRYGFRGGLVPGVMVSACLLHPAAVAWGRDWVERGQAHVVVSSPVYDGETFRVEVERSGRDACDASLFDPHGKKCATAEASLPAAPPDPPRRRHDPLLTRESTRPTASRAVMDRFRESGLGAIRARWSEAAEITSYLREPSTMAPVYRDQRLANPAFLLALSNWVLAANIALSPWLHLETHSQHYGAVAIDTELAVEARIADLFEKKGHEFVDVEVAVFPEADETAILSVRLRAIYKLRAP